MAEATEIVFLPLKEGSDPQGPRFKNSLETILKQGGPHRMFAGAQVEHPNVQTLFIDWSSIDHHMQFTKWEGYKEFLDDAVDQCDTPPALFHVHFEPFPPTPAFSEVTEFIRVYFPADYSPEDQKAYHEGLKKFGSIVKRDWPETRGAASGWVAEELDDPKSGEKSKVYVVLIGWPSVESHMKYRETQSFKDNIHLLRGPKELKNVVMVHVASQQFKV
ncbi:hypothetical protein H2200_004673 [Cladophialophora chaetospira]|uniref:ABM domain-containing protein n=1 Tax=Cladophialophora chaetospira TaxID=386627 RepID=A0AA38XE79_9EURO|nr:hypothetical protein H2200_004673 [Cladophialophora chaetospira]